MVNQEHTAGWDNFDELLGGNFYAKLASTGPVDAALARPSCCNLGGLVTTGSSTPVAMLQIDFIHSASSVNTWTGRYKK